MIQPSNKTRKPLGNSFCPVSPRRVSSQLSEASLIRSMMLSGSGSEKVFSLKVGRHLFLNFGYSSLDKFDVNSV